MIFDFHARLTPHPGADRRLLSTMDSCGIARAAVAAGGVVDLDRLAAQITHGGHTEAGADNAGVLDACAASRGRLVPFHFANPHRGLEEYRRHAARYRGLELSPAVHGVGFDDPRTLELVTVAARARHPVYAVCLARPGMGTADLVKLARRFPTVTFVFGHCGSIGIDVHAVALIAPVANIVVETSGCLMVVVRTALDRLGPRRVLFGTEYPLQHPSVELAKFGALDLDHESWRLVAWRNAHRVLGEEPS
jgi:predicted TIM-barrel fold metal-dependent hydrolase